MKSFKDHIKQSNIQLKKLISTTVFTYDPENVALFKFDSVSTRTQFFKVFDQLFYFDETNLTKPSDFFYREWDAFFADSQDWVSQGVFTLAAIDTAVKRTLSKKAVTSRDLHALEAATASMNDRSNHVMTASLAYNKFIHNHGVGIIYT